MYIDTRVYIHTCTNTHTPCLHTHRHIYIQERKINKNTVYFCSQWLVYWGDEIQLSPSLWIRSFSGLLFLSTDYIMESLNPFCPKSSALFIYNGWLESNSEAEQCKYKSLSHSLNSTIVILQDLSWVCNMLPIGLLTGLLSTIKK